MCFSRLVFAAFLVLLSTAANADGNLSYKWQGIDRTAILHIPEGAIGQPAPLVIVMYGSDDKAANFQKNSGFDAVANREGFITVYPEAIDGAWNIKSRKPMINGEPVDDIGLFRAMIDDLVNRRIADRQRVYATGFSFGALMDHEARKERIVAGDLVAFDKLQPIPNQPFDQMQLAE